MKVPKRSSRQENLQKEEANNLLEQKKDAQERSKVVEEENFVESPVISDDDDDDEDVFVSSDGEGSFHSKSDDVSGNGASGSGRDDTEHDKDDDAQSDDSRTVVEESDSSEDEVAPCNTVGDVPLEWYKEEKHIGYDLAGKKIKKKERQDKLDLFLASVDDSKNWRKIYDEYNDEKVELTKEEVKMIKRLLKGKAPHADFDPYAPYVDWFSWDDSKHPLSSAPGLIKFDEKPKEEPSAYLLWGDDSSAIDRQGLAYIPAPKPKLPGHEESYNPSLEYIPTQEEINFYQLMYEEDRPKFIPKWFTLLRNVPAYEKAVNENFGRCLDLYLCPRARKKRINIDPESLKPKLPSRKDLGPYPTSCYLEYKGHNGSVLSISTESAGQWIASGSSDGTVRIWEVETGRCIRIWEFGESVCHVSWNPLGEDAYLLNTRLGNAEDQKSLEELLRVETQSTPDSDNDKTIVNWVQDNKNGGIRLKHFKTVTSVEWHRKGDYFSTLMPSAQSKAVLIHLLSEKQTQRIPFKIHGIPVSTAFHPSRSAFFISTKKNIRVYDLLKQKLIKKLETGVREVSSVAVHPGGDNLIVGSRDGKLCWFDMDLSSQPYRVLNCHSKDFNRVAFHRSYPLFASSDASSSDDCTAYVFHIMVYSDLNQNPLIVPLEILRGHASENGRGVMDCKFHPRQPWLFTAGADSVIKLYCH
ncbi:unnamed protein product [Withania somnifera]